MVRPCSDTVASSEPIRDLEPQDGADRRSLGMEETFNGRGKIPDHSDGRGPAGRGISRRHGFRCLWTFPGDPKLMRSRESEHARKITVFHGAGKKIRMTERSELGEAEAARVDDQAADGSTRLSPSRCRQWPCAVNSNEDQLPRSVLVMDDE